MDNPVEDALGQPEVEETHVEAPEETPVVEAVVETPPAPAQVPISAMLVEREKRQAAEARARGLEERMGAKPPPDVPPQPDPAAQRYADNLRFSRRFAEREYGKDTVAEVHEWAQAKCEADPLFNAAMRSSDDPYEAAYQAFTRDQIVAKVTPDRLAAFEAWEKAQADLQAATPQPSAATPPASLASSPGTGLRGKSSTLEGEGAAFNALFS